MQRISPPTITSWMLKNGQINKVESLSELGLYSCIFIDTSMKNQEWNEQTKLQMQKHFGSGCDELIMKNESFGTLMRTKGSHSNEGGVNAGYAVIDQPILYFSKSDQYSYSGA